MTSVNTFRARASELDRVDPLRPMRDLFHIPSGLIYLDGNSLGLMPRGASVRASQVTEHEWADGLIRSWSRAGWFDLPITVGNRIAPLIGAGNNEVAVGDSTSVNLFKCLAAALHLNRGRRCTPTGLWHTAGNQPVHAG